MKRSDFFKRNVDIAENYIEKDIHSAFEVNEKKEEEIRTVYKKRSGIIDRNIIQYVIENFPSMSVEIRNSLINLVNTLEKTIDFIEDKSSAAIKDSRDFDTAESYRSKALSLYQVAQGIDEYIDWMRNEYEKNNEILEVKPTDENKLDILEDDECACDSEIKYPEEI